MTDEPKRGRPRKHVPIEGRGRQAAAREALRAAGGAVVQVELDATAVMDLEIAKSRTGRTTREVFQTLLAHEADRIFSHRKDVDMSFQTFKNGPGKRIAEHLLPIDLDQAPSWQAMQELAMHHRPSFGGEIRGSANFHTHVKDFYGVASKGERAVIVAILYAVDYRDMAETLMTSHDDTLFRLVDSASEDYRAAVAACIARIEPRTR